MNKFLNLAEAYTQDETNEELSNKLVEAWNNLAEEEQKLISRILYLDASILIHLIE